MKAGRWREIVAIIASKQGGLSEAIYGSGDGVGHRHDKCVG